MCGIFGIVGLGIEIGENEKKIEAITNLLAHRGPDSSGVYLDRFVALGHRRLSILDLSVAANQPMFGEDGLCGIVFNGEIYNFNQLKRDLLEGERFFSSSDTEVVLKGIRKHGIDFISRFNGMFAFAFYDRSNLKVYIARDRLGIKPLYYAFVNDKLVFCSEIKGILAYMKSEGLSPLPDYKSVSSFLSFRYPPFESTMFKDIKTLNAGSFLEVDIRTGEIREKRYWNLFKKGYVGQERDCIEESAALLKKAVEYRMISDVPVGAFLSGGLDSSIIVALMSGEYGKNIKTFSVGFDIEGFNEFEYARAVAERFNTDHTEILLKSENYLNNLVSLVSYKDLPPGVVNEPAIYEMTKQMKKDITVVLSGEGADELFCGYGRIFRSPYDFERMREILKYERELSHDNLFKEIKRVFVDKYGNLDFSDEFDFFFARYQYMTLEDKGRFFSRDFLKEVEYDGEVREKARDLFYEEDNLSFYDRIVRFFQLFHLKGLLLRLDATTMANSIEGRVPFVDHELIEYVYSIPFDLKIKWKSPFHKLLSFFATADIISENYDIPKYILKKKFSEILPPNIAYRKKMGFPVPVFKWLGSDFRDFARDIFSDKRARERGIYNTNELLYSLDKGFKDYAEGLKVWMILSLELWFRAYFDGE